jgi:hypothetical protein
MIIKSHKKLSCISCLFILFLIGCTESANDGSLERKEVAPIATTITATDSLMINTSEHVIVPFAILNVNDTYLIATQFDTDRLLNVFSLPDLRYLYTWGSHGRGPAEYTQPPLFFNTPGGDTLVMSDVLGFKQDTYVVNDSSLVTVSSDKLRYTGQFDPLSRVRKISDSMYIGDFNTSDVNDNHEYILLKTNQPDFFIKFGDYPTTDWPDYYQRQAYYVKSNAFNKKLGVFAAFYMNANAIKLFDASGALLNHIMFDDFDYSSADMNTNVHEFQRSIYHSDDTYIYTIGYYRKNALDDPDDNKPT